MHVSSDMITIKSLYLLDFSGKKEKKNYVKPCNNFLTWKMLWQAGRWKVNIIKRNLVT